MTGREALGIDIGGVIIDLVREERGAGSDAFAAASPVDGAFDAIARLAARRFHDRIWLVSRCDEGDEPAIRQWLARREFFPSTGVARDRVCFCRERHQKAPICRQLGITHFIDDRLEVLGHMIGTVPHLYLLRSRAADHERFPQFLPHVRFTSRWSEVLNALLGSPA